MGTCAWSAMDSVLKFQALNIKEYIFLPIKPIKTDFCYEIPTGGDTRSTSSKFLRQLHWSQWESLDLAIFSKRGCLRLFVPVLPSLWISKWGLVHFGPTQWEGVAHPYFSSSLPGLWVLGFAASVNFLLVETVNVGTRIMSRQASCLL